MTGTSTDVSNKGFYVLLFNWAVSRWCQVMRYHVVFFIDRSEVWQALLNKLARTRLKPASRISAVLAWGLSSIPSKIAMNMSVTSFKPASALIFFSTNRFADLTNHFRSARTSYASSAALQGNATAFSRIRKLVCEASRAASNRLLLPASSTETVSNDRVWLNEQICLNNGNTVQFLLAFLSYFKPILL